MNTWNRGFAFAVSAVFFASVVGASLSNSEKTKFGDVREALSGYSLRPLNVDLDSDVDSELWSRKVAMVRSQKPYDGMPDLMMDIASEKIDNAKKACGDLLRTRGSDGSFNKSLDLVRTYCSVDSKA